MELDHHRARAALVNAELYPFQSVDGPARVCNAVLELEPTCLTLLDTGEEIPREPDRKFALHVRPRQVKAIPAYEPEKPSAMTDSEKLWLSLPMLRGA